MFEGRAFRGRRGEMQKYFPKLSQLDKMEELYFQHIIMLLNPHIWPYFPELFAAVNTITVLVVKTCFAQKAKDQSLLKIKSYMMQSDLV